MPASSSIALSRATIAFFSASARLPTAMTVVLTICIAIGMHATRMTTTVESASSTSSPDCFTFQKMTVQHRHESVKST